MTFKRLAIVTKFHSMYLTATHPISMCSTGLLSPVEGKSLIVAIVTKIQLSTVTVEIANRDSYIMASPERMEDVIAVKMNQFRALNACVPLRYCDLLISRPTMMTPAVHNLNVAASSV